MSKEVHRMFSEIAGRYDFMNDLLSFGIHHRWRKKAVRLSGASDGDSIIDCASGTGDLSIAFKKKIGNSGYVLGTDFVPEMIELAKEKARIKNFIIDFEVDDAMDLHQPDNKFDYSSISFGIRNVDDPVKCLKEMARVVKPRGKVVVIEFGQPKGLFSILYKFYSFALMPLLGKIFAMNRAAYEYLPETASKFPCREDFIELMNRTENFQSSVYYPLSFGIAYIYIGIVKPGLSTDLFD